MINLVSAELAKIRALRSTWLLVAFAALFCGGWTAAGVLIFDTLPPNTTAPMDQRLATIYQMAQQGYLAALLLGVLGMTGEYRHQTITWAFLVTPVRHHLLVAKTVAHLLVGLAIGLIGAVVTTACATILLTIRGLPGFDGSVVGILLGCVLSTAGYALLGLAVGALIRNQAAAIAVAFGWLYYGEYMLSAFLPVIGKWLPAGAARALIGGRAIADGALLPIWAGAVVFTGYVVVIGVLAQLVTLRRDVT